MSAISEEMLVAYADGELDEINRRRVERALAEDAALAARLDAHKRLAAMLGAEYAPVVKEPVPDRFRALIEASAKVVAIPAAAPVRKVFRWTPVAIAASLALGMFVGHDFGGGASDPVGMKDGQMIAQGALAKALDRQLASVQGVDAQTRIGLSFKAKTGEWCRSFDGRDVSGVACRSSENWRLEQALPGVGKQADYRQASSGDPRVLATVEALMADAPADATAEKGARDKGWRR